MSNVRVIVTAETDSGRNLRFHDTLTGQDMTRAQFVRAIDKGEYPDYYNRKIRGIVTPVSKPNKSIHDNLG
ncbi:MAG: hypothetical protein Q4C10_13680 [Clostridia bacterium]|nr:hypothetical protein [Clostridia bacterium]